MSNILQKGMVVIMDMEYRRKNGLAYIVDEFAFEEQKECRKLLQELNSLDLTDFEGIQLLVKKIFGKSGNLFLNPHFYCDYGFNIEVGDNFFANFNCTIIDVAKVIIGSNCMLGPNVSIFTAGHPLHPKTRNFGYQYGKEVKIGNNVWIGGGTIICPGVEIGDCVVIGAGSIVTKKIPSWSLAAGNPCKVIRAITDKDEFILFKNEQLDQYAIDSLVE